MALALPAVDRNPLNTGLLDVASRLALMGGWEVDLATRRVRWSDAVCAIHDLPPGSSPTVEEAIAFYPQGWRAKIRSAFDACARDGIPYDEETQIVTAKGRRVWVRAIGQAVRDGQGRITHVRGALQDISRQKEAEGEAVRAHQRLVHTLETMTDAFITLDREWRLTYINREGQRLLRRRRYDVLGKVLWDEFPEAIGTVFEREYRRACAGNDPVTFEAHYPPLERWFEVRAFPSEEGLAIYFHDVTDRRHIREALRRSEERFRLVARVTGDTIWDWDVGTDTMWWSENLRLTFELDPATMPSAAAWSERIHPADRPRVRDGLTEFLNGKSNAWSTEYRFARADGSFAHVMDHGLAIRDEHGKAVRLLGAMSDISQRRKLEDDLRQAQRLEAVGQLTGGVAHDFNNLLTVILGNAGAIMDGLAHDPSLRELAELTRTAAQQGAALTSRLLAFARRQELKPAPIDVRELVRGSESLLRKAAGERVVLDIQSRPSLWCALIDPVQLEAALLNLCINARDAMPRGGRITIELANHSVTERGPDGETDVTVGDYVAIVVRDNGVGMSPEVAARAFEPFFTTKEIGKGSGLGLSMIYGFAKQSGGHVRIESRIGQGTTVTLLLPRAPSGRSE